MTENNQDTKKRGIRQAVKDAAKESGISVLKILAAAAAAVTMALISSRLTSIFNSLMLVAVVSVTSALVGEFYRIFFSVAAQGTKKVAKEVIVPIVHPDGESDEVDLTETTVIGSTGLDDTVVEDAVTVEDTAQGEVISADLTTEDTGGDGGEGKGPGDLSSSPEETKDSRRQARRKRQKNALRSNQFVQLSLVFGVVSLITVGVVYAVARSQGKTDITYNYTTVQKNPVEQLTPEQQQALVDMAVAATNAETEESEQDGSTTEQPDDVASQLEILETEVADLTQQNQDLQATIDALTANLNSETEKTSALEERLQVLETLVSQLQGNGGTTPPTGGVD